MSNYNQITDFSAKDSLSSGDPAKVIRGADVDAELDAISTAITSKEDSANKGAADGYCGLDSSGLVDPTDLPQATATAIGAAEIATQAETDAQTNDTKMVTPLKLANAPLPSGNITGTVAIANGGTNASTASAARTNLGLGSLATQNSINDNDWSGTDLAVANGGTGASTATAARTNLGLGDLAVQSSINDSDWSGTDLAVANGGTGASTAAGARTNLGLAIGSDVQAYDAGLADIAGLAVTNGNFIVGNGTNWVAESGATARTSLGLGLLATANTINDTDWSGTDLAVANGGTGASTAAGARTNLGLGSLAVQNTINDGDWSGTDLAIANGGTGASTAAGARTNLDVYSTSEVDSSLSTKLDASEVDSGTYTPTISATTNITSTTVNGARYMKVGSVVTVSVNLDIDRTSSGFTTLELSLPVASNFASRDDCAGFIGGEAAGSENQGGVVADATNDTAEASFTAASGGSAPYVVHFTYEVI